MAAAPGAPPSFTFPPTMIGSLTEIGTYLDAQNLPAAKARFAVLTGIPNKLYADVTALFREVETGPKTAAAAPPPTAASDYRSRITHLLNEAQKAEQTFLDALPEPDAWEGIFSHLMIFSHRLVCCARAFLKQPPEDNQCSLFLKDYYIGINDFIKTGKTKALIDAISFYCLPIANQPPKKRVIYRKVDAHSLNVMKNGFLGLVTDFLTALKYSESARLRNTSLDRETLPIASLSYGGYARLSLFQRAFGELIDIYSVLDKEIILSVNRIHLNMLQETIGDRLELHYRKKFIRKLFKLHKSVQQKCCDLCNETQENYHRYGALYDPIFNNPHYQKMLDTAYYKPATIEFLQEQEVWLREFPNFVTTMHLRTNQNIEFICSGLKTLLDLHTWMLTANLREWQAENQSFDQLVASLPEKLQKMGAADYKKLKTLLEANPFAAAYRELLRNKMQAVLAFQSAFNGMFALYTDNIDITDRLRCLANFSEIRTWGSLEPYTRYQSIRWPTGEVEDTCHYSLKLLGLKPEKRRFDFLGHLSLSDLPFLEKIDEPRYSSWIALCIAEVRKLRPLESVCVFPEPVSSGPVLSPLVEAPVDPVDECEVKAAAEAIPEPIVALQPVPAIHRIREILLERMVNAQKRASSVDTKKTLKQAETQLRILLALANSFEIHIHHCESMRAQIFHACVSIVEAVNLMFEQTLQAIAIQHPIANGEPFSPTHDIQMLILKNPVLICYLNADEYRIILDTNCAGFDARDVPFLVPEGRTNTASQRLLIEAFKHQIVTEPLPLAPLVTNLCTYSSNAFKVMATLLDYCANPKKKATRPEELSTLTTQWQTSLNTTVKDLKPLESMPPTTLQAKASTHISAIATFVITLRHPKLLGEADYAPLFDNLLHNKLSRLQTEMEKQSILNPDELSGHLATILNLTHLIAADVLYLHLLSLEHAGHTVTIPDTGSLKELVASHKGKDLPTHLADFVNARLPNAARYAETAESKGSKQTKAAAKQMKRAIAHSAAAAPAASAPAAIAADEADIKTGFEKVELRVVVETKEQAVKYIERLRELIVWVCVAPKK